MTTKVIILPNKEKFSNNESGAASIFAKESLKPKDYKSYIIYGNSVNGPTLLLSFWIGIFTNKPEIFSSSLLSTFLVSLIEINSGNSSSASSLSS